ncbi:MAG: aminoacyl-tRNA hydrolase [Candidatus Nitrosopolaris sp.]|jgi:peptidyl-tRNA hydrolase
MKLKQAIIVRTDLGMGKGKIAGQVAHAAVEAAESIRRYCPDWYYSWLEDDSLETRIILKVDSQTKLQALSRDAFAQALGIDFGKYGKYSYNGGSRFRTESFIFIPAIYCLFTSM